MLCPRCGTPNRAQASVCVKCGANIAARGVIPSVELDDLQTAIDEAERSLANMGSGSRTDPSQLAPFPPQPKPTPRPTAVPSRPPAIPAKPTAAVPPKPTAAVPPKPAAAVPPRPTARPAPVAPSVAREAPAGRSLPASRGAPSLGAARPNDPEDEITAVHAASVWPEKPAPVADDAPWGARFGSAPPPPLPRSPLAAGARPSAPQKRPPDAARLGPSPATRAPGASDARRPTAGDDPLGETSIAPAGALAGRAQESTRALEKAIEPDDLAGLIDDLQLAAIRARSNPRGSAEALGRGAHDPDKTADKPKPASVDVKPKRVGTPGLLDPPANKPLERPKPAPGDERPRRIGTPGLSDPPKHAMLDERPRRVGTPGLDEKPRPVAADVGAPRLGAADLGAPRLGAAGASAPRVTTPAPARLPMPAHRGSLNTNAPETAHPELSGSSLIIPRADDSGLGPSAGRAGGGAPSLLSERTLSSSDEDAGAPVALSFQLPSFSRRVAASLIDATVIALLVGAPMSMGAFGDTLARMDWLEPDHVSAALASGQLLIPAIAALVLVFAASTLSHGFAGRSLGKLLLGLELVTKNQGARPTLFLASIRGALTLLSLALCGAGYFFVLINRRERTLHDVLSGTVTVLASSRREVSSHRERIASPG